MKRVIKIPEWLKIAADNGVIDSNDMRWKNLQFKLQNCYTMQYEPKILNSSQDAVVEVIELPLLKRIWRYFNG